MCVLQGSHSAAKAAKAVEAVKMVDFERKAVKAVKLYIFSSIWLQKLHYCPVSINLSFNILLKIFSLECYKQRDSN